MDILTLLGGDEYASKKALIALVGEEEGETGKITARWSLITHFLCVISTHLTEWLPISTPMADRVFDLNKIFLKQG